MFHLVKLALQVFNVPVVGEVGRCSRINVYSNVLQELTMGRASVLFVILPVTNAEALRRGVRNAMERITSLKKNAIQNVLEY